MERIVFNVEGMLSSHCEKAVLQSVGAIDGVKSVEVDLAAKMVTVEFDVSDTKASQIKSAIESIGYQVV